MEFQFVFSKEQKLRWAKGRARSRKKVTKSQIKNVKIEHFEIAKSALELLQFQRYIVFMGLDNFIISYWPSKKVFSVTSRKCLRL